MTLTDNRDGGGQAQDRPTVAAWPRSLSLEMRLAVAVALSVAAVIGLLTLVGVRVGERRLEDDLRETARVTAAAVADDLELRPAPASAIGVAAALHEFMSAAPSVRSITVFRNAEDGLSILASTSSAPAPPPGLVERVMKAGALEWQDRAPNLATVAVPVMHGKTPSAVVVVTVSMDPVEQFRRAGRLAALGGTLAAIAGITILIHLLMRRMVLAPLAEIRRVMSLAGTGRMAMRVDVRRRDELGELADDLNEMLAELDDLHRSLHDRVRRGTEELRQRNEQLVRSYESVLELRETAARAQQLAAVGQTMANLAHQIGTPLNLVSGHVQLLRQVSDDPAIQRRLRIIEEQVEKVATSVRQVLDRARPQADRAQVDVGAMLVRLADSMRPRLGTSGVVIANEIADDLPTVLADETQLELALLNIVKNAVDAMPAGGTLALRGSRGDSELGERVHIEIQDTGSGIPPELLARIFEPWITTKPRTRGAGLGLSITRDVIESLGGTIAAASTPGAGSTFTIDLPAAVTVGAPRS
jgi:signal transduction histidine kinase